VLNCSFGQSSWELTLALASSRKLPLRLFIPIAEDKEPDRVANQVRHEFALDYPDVELVFVGADEKLSKPEAMKARDQVIIKQSDILIPVAVRRGGFMDRAVTSPGGKYVVTSFAVPHQTRRVGLAYAVEPSDLSPEARSFDEPYVIHWTRTATGPWPSETKLEYYCNIAAADEYPRIGFHTLRRILDTRCICASTRRMPGGLPCACFSSLPPGDAAPLMRWRSRYRCMSFEPYGVGFKKPVAETLGILPVRYYDPDSESAPEGEERWRWQSCGLKTDWRQECEYRHRGDVHFDRVADEDIVVFCRFQSEAEHLRREFGLRVIAVTNQ
jgi:hypothetical protein